MKRNLTRVLSMLLAVLFCLSAVPTQAYAVGTESGIVIGDGSGSTPTLTGRKTTEAVTRFGLPKLRKREVLFNSLKLLPS